MSELASINVSDAVATLTMNRAEKRNALSPELIGAIDARLGEVEAAIETGGIRTVVLAGAGKAFCAGMDLEGVLADPAAMAGMLHGLSQVMRRIRRLRVPTIARVQGAAIGGGCGMMVVCDFAITHPEAKVGYPEVGLGVCPAVVAPWLIRKVGPGRARRMLLEGGTMRGTEGFEQGLADRLVDRDELEAETMKLARKLSGGGPHAMAVTKHWLNELDGSLEDAVFDKAAALSAEVIAGEEAQQRLRRLFGNG